MARTTLMPNLCGGQNHSNQNKKQNKTKEKTWRKEAIKVRG